LSAADNQVLAGGRHIWSRKC